MNNLNDKQKKLLIISLIQYMQRSMALNFGKESSDGELAKDLSLWKLCLDASSNINEGKDEDLPLDQKEIVMKSLKAHIESIDDSRLYSDIISEDYLEKMEKTKKEASELIKVLQSLGF